MISSTHTCFLFDPEYLDEYLGELSGFYNTGIEYMNQFLSQQDEEDDCPRSFNARLERNI